MKYPTLVMAIIIPFMLFLLKLRGMAGALILGITVLIVDYVCLRLRINLLRSSRTGLKSAAIIGGFLARLINIVGFMLIGGWWLVPTAHWLFCWILITIPLWNLLSAIRLADRT